MNTELDPSITEQWEAGKLGVNRESVRVAPPEISAALDRATAMKLVTMRLPVPMIEALKAIAQFHGIGYQPMVRDLLGRFIDSEVAMILSIINGRVAEASPEKTVPVDNFMERRASCG